MSPQLEGLIQAVLAVMSCLVALPLAVFAFLWLLSMAVALVAAPFFLLGEAASRLYARYG